MQIICVSRGSQSRGEEFAEKLATKLGYECISREQLLEEATGRKIPIGKLETAIIKPHTFSEGLAVEMEHYKALATSILCEKALEKNIVYHGRTGHLLLPGIENILKIRVVADMEYRIQHVMRRFDIPRSKARKYVDQVEEDRRRWVKHFYGVEWDVFALYDLVLNLTYVSVDNAASAVCSMAQLPEFQATPATVSTIKNLYLTSQARLMLAIDDRTSSLNAKVRISDRNLYVIYPYQQAKQAAFIPQVLEGLEGVETIVGTQAETNILWIQEVFGKEDPSYEKILSMAKTWDAAVELIKLIPTDEPRGESPPETTSTESTDTWRETGIMEERDEVVDKDAEDVSEVYQRLINDGRAGGKRVLRGDQKTLLGAIDRTIGYRLIVFDQVFLSKGHATQIRLQREWSNALAESLRVPVVTMKEIVSRYHFGARQAVRMVTFAILATLIVFTVFRFSDAILAVLSKEGLRWRVLATACVFVFVPAFAYIYSTVTSLFLKMIKLD
jgi:cytidylate kinase